MLGTCWTRSLILLATASLQVVYPAKWSFSCMPMLVIDLSTEAYQYPTIILVVFLWYLALSSSWQGTTKYVNFTSLIWALGFGLFSTCRCTPLYLATLFACPIHASSILFESAVPFIVINGWPQAFELSSILLLWQQDLSETTLIAANTLVVPVLYSSSTWKRYPKYIQGNLEWAADFLKTSTVVVQAWNKQENMMWGVSCTLNLTDTSVCPSQ